MKRYQKGLKNLMKIIFVLSIIVFISLSFYLTSEVCSMNNILNDINATAVHNMDSFLNRDVPEIPKQCFEEIVQELHFENIDCHVDSFEICLQNRGDSPYCYIELDEVTLNSNKSYIFIYGGSSVVDGSPDLFSKQLEILLEKENVKIINFGLGGADSGTINQRVLSLSQTSIEPDLAIIYSGHNDYTNYYHWSIFNNFFNDFLKYLSYITFTRLHHPVPGRDFRGPFFNLLQNLNIVNFNGDDFSIINERILEHFIKNNEEIQEFLTDRDIPIIYMTTIGNLEAEPYGDIDITKKYYEDGMDSEDYINRIHYLRKAMDSELFTYDIRAHSDLNNYILSLSNRTNIYVLDVENKLIEEKFNFGHDDFSDYLHFRASTHNKIANHLYNFIIENHLLD